MRAEFCAARKKGPEDQSKMRRKKQEQMTVEKELLADLTNFFENVSKPFEGVSFCKCDPWARYVTDSPSPIPLLLAFWTFFFFFFFLPLFFPSLFPFPFHLIFLPHFLFFFLFFLTFARTLAFEGDVAWHLLKKFICAADSTLLRALWESTFIVRPTPSQKSSSQALGLQRVTHSKGQPLSI